MRFVNVRAAYTALLILFVGMTGCAVREPEALVPRLWAALQAHRAAGQMEQALYLVQRLGGEVGWTAELYQLGGDLLAEKGDLSSAAANWDAARLLSPGDPRLLQRLAQAYLDLGQWAQAAVVLRELIAAAPENTWAQYHLALIAAPRDPAVAQAALTRPARDPAYSMVATDLLRLIETYRADPRLSLLVGGLLAENGLWAYAEQAYRHAAILNHPSAEALAYVGLTRSRQGLDGDPWIDAALQTELESPAVFYVQGLHLRTENDMVGSLNALIQAVLLDPNNPALYAELGSAYRLVGDLQGAEYWLKVAVDVSQNAPQFQELLAMFYAETGHNLDAGGLPILELAAAALPNSPNARAAYGWGLYQSGERERGLAELDAALRLDPNNPRALFFRALVALEAGETDAAVQALEAVANSASRYAGDAARLLEEIAPREEQTQP